LELLEKEVDKPLVPRADDAVVRMILIFLFACLALLFAAVVLIVREAYLLLSA
jgi:hypothetical protein